MANYATLKAAIQQVIKTNGNEEITGALLQQSLLAMIGSLGAGYQFAGVAVPATNPGTPDQNVIYLAFDAGTYSNFGGSVLTVGQVGIFTYNGSWAYTVKTVIELVNDLTTGGTNKALAAQQGVILAGQISQLGQKVTENADGIAELKNTVLSSQTIESKNLLNTATLNEGKYVNDNGNLSGNANYNASDYIPVKEGEVYSFQRGGYAAADRTKQTINQIAGYDENKSFVSGSYVTYGNSYTVPQGVKYVRFSADAVYLRAAAYPSFTKGTTVIAYYDYSEDIIVNTLQKKIIPQNIKNGVVFEFDINNSDFESDIEFQHMCAYGISFKALIGTFNEIRIGKGYQAFMGATLGIDNTNIYVYEGANTTPIITDPHGLTFKDYIGLAITTGYGNVASLKLYTNGGSYTKQYFAWDARKGTFFVKSIGTNVLNYCTFGYYCYAFEKPTWIYGDSYLTNAQGVTNRWPSYLIAGNHTNYLLNGYPGRGSTEALLSLKTDLNYGTPKRIIWCLGMNDGDNGAINPAWKAAVDELVGICRDNHIELILAKIPNVPTVINSYKTAYITRLNYRNIDFSRAVLINVDGTTWYDDMLSNDGVHPTVQGAIALYQQAICDVPELLS